VLLHENEFLSIEMKSYIQRACRWNLIAIPIQEGRRKVGSSERSAPDCRDRQHISTRLQRVGRTQAAPQLTSHLPRTQTVRFECCKLV